LDWRTSAGLAVITIGIQYGGPELNGSPIEQLLSATMKAVYKERGPWVGSDDFGPGDARPASGPYFEKGSVPAVNVIFQVPGSLLGVKISSIQAGRFSRKQKMVLVEVPVSKDIVESGGSVQWVIDALHRANAIAADVFARKGAEPFDLDGANALVEKVRVELLRQGFE
jgi:hypothetical protein